MQQTHDHLQIAAVLVHAVAMQALLAFVVGTVERRRLRPTARSLTLGAVFSAAAISVMTAPAELPGGFIVDGRMAIVGLGAAYAGPAGAALIALSAAGYRYGVVSGPGDIYAAAGIVVGALVGVACGLVAARLREVTLAHMAAAGAALTLALAPLLTMPWAEIGPFMIHIAPMIVVSNIAGAMVLGSLLKREARLLAREVRLDAQAHCDPLTGLGNRRRLEETFAALQREARRGAVAVLDIDHFKRINDEFGHGVGDEILEGFARRLQANIRAGDLVVRQGGEEFVILMPQATESQAAGVVERLLDAIRDRPFETAAGPVRVTASAGLAPYAAAGEDSLGRALEAADRQLYLAKAGGRDRLRRTLAKAA